MKKTFITASMLYNYIKCPHRVTMDLFADPAEKDKISPFVQLLCDKWVETEDLQVKQRILDYNEDDCLAMRILVDAIRKMKPQPEII